MNITAIVGLAMTARAATFTSPDDANALHDSVSALTQLVDRDPEDLGHLHRRNAQDLVALAERVLRGQAPREAAAAERAAPGATRRLLARYDGQIAAARAGL